MVGNTAEFIPQSFDLTSEFTPTGGPSHIGSFTAAKTNPHGDPVLCSIDVTTSSDEGTFHSVDTVTGFFTPARKPTLPAIQECRTPRLEIRAREAR